MSDYIWKRRLPVRERQPPLALKLFSHPVASGLKLGYKFFRLMIFAVVFDKRSEKIIISH
jgi:hypothetical protein